MATTSKGKKNVEKGRTLLELLGVLVVVSLLMIGTLYMYMKVLEDNTSDRAYEDIMLALSARYSRGAGRDTKAVDVGPYGKTRDGRDFTLIDNCPTRGFTIKINDIGDGVCRRLYQRLSETTLFKPLAFYRSGSWNESSCSPESGYSYIRSLDDCSKGTVFAASYSLKNAEELETCTNDADCNYSVGTNNCRKCSDQKICVNKEHACGGKICRRGGKCEEACEEGEYWNETTETCELCPEDAECEEGQILCKAGYYLDGSECKECTGRTYSEKGDNSCHSCDQLYKANMTHTACDVCSRGESCGCGENMASNGDQNNPQCICWMNGTAGYEGASGCLECPENATCDGDNFSCDVGYKEEAGSCVCDPQENKLTCAEECGANACKVGLSCTNSVCECAARSWCLPAGNDENDCPVSHTDCASGLLCHTDGTCINACPVGYTESDGHCCLEGQYWDLITNRCVACESHSWCLPAGTDENGCAIGHTDCTGNLKCHEDGTCVDTCPTGYTESDGHCCPNATPTWYNGSCMDIECTTDDQCGSGKYCKNGVCFTQCEEGYHHYTLCGAEDPSVCCRKHLFAKNGGCFYGDYRGRRDFSCPEDKPYYNHNYELDDGFNFIERCISCPQGATCTEWGITCPGQTYLDFSTDECVSCPENSYLRNGGGNGFLSLGHTAYMTTLCPHGWMRNEDMFFCSCYGAFRADKDNNLCLCPENSSTTVTGEKIADTGCFCEYPYVVNPNISKYSGYNNHRENPDVGSEVYSCVDYCTSNEWCDSHGYNGKYCHFTMDRYGNYITGGTCTEVTSGADIYAWINYDADLKKHLIKSTTEMNYFNAENWCQKQIIDGHQGKLVTKETLLQLEGVYQFKEQECNAYEIFEDFINIRSDTSIYFWIYSPDSKQAGIFAIKNNGYCVEVGKGKALMAYALCE